MSNGLIAAVLDARRGELYYSLYRSVPGGVQRISDPAVCSPADVASHVMAVGGDVMLVGDGAHRYSEHFAGLSKAVIADQSLSYPSAAALVQLAHARALREQFDRPSDVTPIYLRRPDAEINWTTRHSAP